MQWPACDRRRDAAERREGSAPQGVRRRDEGARAPCVPSPEPRRCNPDRTRSASSPPDLPEQPRTRASALRLTPEEAQRVRIAIRKVARARGGFVALAVALGIPTNTLYHAARPGSRPSPGLAICLAAVAKVSMDALLTGSSPSRRP